MSTVSTVSFRRHRIFAREEYYFEHLADAGEEVVDNLVVQRTAEESCHPVAVTVVDARFHLPFNIGSVAKGFGQQH